MFEFTLDSLSLFPFCFSQGIVNSRLLNDYLHRVFTSADGNQPAAAYRYQTSHCPGGRRCHLQINSTAWKERSFSTTQWSWLKAQQLHVTETTLRSVLLRGVSNCRACGEGFFFAWKIPSAASVGNIFEISRDSPVCYCSPFACKCKMPRFQVQELKISC